MSWKYLIRLESFTLRAIRYWLMQSLCSIMTPKRAGLAWVCGGLDWKIELLLLIDVDILSRFRIYSLHEGNICKYLIFLDMIGLSGSLGRFSVAVKNHRALLSKSQWWSATRSVILWPFALKSSSQDRMLCIIVIFPCNFWKIHVLACLLKIVLCINRRTCILKKCLFCHATCEVRISKILFLPWLSTKA